MIAIPYYETSNFVFSNFSAHLVNYEGWAYPTVEHAFHAQKFEDKDLRSQIQNCPSPIAAWGLARKLKPQRRTDWDDIKIEVMTNIIRSKIEQNPDVKTALLATGNEEIVEVNQYDDFWGNGPDGNGQNHTGKIFMKLREELRVYNE